MIKYLGSSLYAGHAKARNEEGSSLVEFAISATLLFTILFGAIEFSLAVYSYFYVSDAAREATRYAIVRGSTLTTDCTAPGYATCIAQTGDIQTYVKNLGYPGIIPNNLTVTTTWLTTAGAACGTTDSCKAPGNQVQVKVSYNFPLAIPFVPTGKLSFSSTSQMFIAQ